MMRVTRYLNRQRNTWAIRKYNKEGYGEEYTHFLGICDKNHSKKQQSTSMYIYILKYFFKCPKGDFQLQYFSNKSVFSRTHISDNIELMTCFPNFTIEMYSDSCDHYSDHLFEGAGLKLIAGIRKNIK